VSLQDLLARCPRCRRTIVLACSETSGSLGPRLFDAVPWAPADEPEPEGMTRTALSTWRRELPYRMLIAYIDFELGTWQHAMINAKERLRRLPMFKPHKCD
jgi:hypothetical protein